MSDITRLEQLRTKLKIDEHSLEIELRDYPRLVDEVGQEHVNAISLRDEAKQTLDETEARVDSDIRRDAAVNEEKVTEKDVESQKRLSPTVIKANKRYFELKHLAAQWGVLKEAIEKRSYALSKLVDLYIANYYSEIEKKGSTDLKTIQASRAKSELAKRRREMVD